jgi:RNA polymerase sigma-70 factor, ECF subfamily
MAFPAPRRIPSEAAPGNLLASKSHVHIFVAPRRYIRTKPCSRIPFALSHIPKLFISRCLSLGLSWPPECVLVCMLQQIDHSTHRYHPGTSESKFKTLCQERAQAETDSSAAREDALVAAARTGDAQAFGELTERHRGACLKRAMLMIRNRTAAEDEVQNAFWKAFQHLEQFRGEGTFPAWLSRIVENQCLMRIREERNSRFVYLDQSTDSNVRMELVGQLSSPEDQLGLNEVVKLLRTEISRIPPLLRNVMLLRDLDQLSMPEVAVRLGLSVPAAKSRLMRARMELRSRITRHCGRKGAGTLTQVAKLCAGGECWVTA